MAENDFLSVDDQFLATALRWKGFPIYRKDGKYFTIQEAREHIAEYRALLAEVRGL